MNPRIVLVAPLALAAVLNAQETPTSPGATTEQQIKKLQNDKTRLQQEIEHAKKQVRSASSRLANKMRRGKPNFGSIDAGKPATMRQLSTNRVQRRTATVGTPDQMKVGGGAAMVVVNKRGIGEQLVNDVVKYLNSYSPEPKADLATQRVLYDLIRIEGVSGTFVDDNGKVMLGEALASLQNGDMTFAYAAENYATVKGANEKGELTVTRNSVQGPLFEFVAFNTEVGEVSRPFLSPRGWVVLKVEEYQKGEQPMLDKVQCSVALFKFTDDDDEMQQALYSVTSGQAEVLVRDRSVFDKLPALYRPTPQKSALQEQMNSELRTLQASMQKLIAAGEGASAEANKLREQIAKIKTKQKAMIKQERKEADAKAAADQVDGAVESAPPIKRTRKSAVGNKKSGGGN